MRRNGDADLREAERWAAASGSRDDLEVLHELQVRLDRDRFVDQAEAFLRSMPPWVPAWVARLSQENVWTQTDRNRRLRGRFLVLSKGVVASTDDLVAESARTKDEIAGLVLKDLFLDWPDVIPWFAVLVVDLLHGEPVPFSFSVEVPGAAGASFSTWDEPPTRNPGADETLRELERAAEAGGRDERVALYEARAEAGLEPGAVWCRPCGRLAIPSWVESGPWPTAQAPSGTPGYARRRADDAPICYACAAEDERRVMHQTGDVWLYLDYRRTRQGNVPRDAKVVFARADAAGELWAYHDATVSDFAGALSYPVQELKVALGREEAWFVDEFGERWHCVVDGDGMLARCRRLPEATTPRRRP